MTDLRRNHLVLRGGRVMDPTTGEDAVRDVIVVDGVLVEAVGEEAGEPTVVDVSGRVVAPAFADPHVHFREPGDGKSETVASGLAAAERGGYADVLAMANTKPVNDDPEITRAMRASAAASGSPVRLHVVTAATIGLAGEVMADLAAQKEAGCIAVSDDGMPIVDDAMMEQVMRTSHGLEMPVLSHCETPHLHPGGVAHDGAPARELGLPIIPGESEANLVRRDIALAERTGLPVHLCHVSTAASVEAVAEARSRGVPVTGEAAPHHLVLSDENLRTPAPDGTPDAHLKMNPPLRDPADRDAVVQALRDGVLDCIATDHAPHDASKKRGAGFVDAAFGVIGLENAFVALYHHLVRPGHLDLMTLLQRMGPGAAAAGGMPVGS
ncbi:MAG: dihydroorotase, partial [Planctomycetota bacterium]